MPRGAARGSGLHSGGKLKARRASYDITFKTHVVRTALQKPPNNRIKPTCALFPGIEPCQVRKWRLMTPRHAPATCGGFRRLPCTCRPTCARRP